MSAHIEETAVMEVVFEKENPAMQDTNAFLKNEAEVWSHNLDAMRVQAESLDAFLDLLSVCDTEYMDQVEEYAPAAMTEYAEVDAEPMVEWSVVEAALGESQQILIGVQKLLSETLAEMGIEDAQFVRVYSDMNGFMRVVGSHDRQDEIEAVLNSPENAVVRDLYRAATSGMNVAGGLVGNMSIPTELWERIKSGGLVAAG